jgi:DNA invertase Pin-like site-specific DNA recombinase
MLKQNKIYNVAVYCRLSKEDGDKEESASIDTQKAILTEYVKAQGWRLVSAYIDDGYTGLNFNRPRFQAMIKDIESGLIDCVITKDLSRFGRNYLDCGIYLEVFFPEHGVRYIAVNDGVDTLNKTAMDITPFRNILNEMYSADVSMKVKTAVRARFNQGKFKAATPPYGYIKDPADKNHLLIDERVAPIVRKMFDLALEGNGIAKIRHWVNAQNALRPAAYALERGDKGFERYFEGNGDNRFLWSENSVRGILRSPVYAGHLVGYKRPAVSMKSRKRPSRLPEDWEVVPNTHEPIVPQETFDTVQRLITSRRSKGESGYDNVFSGVIKCADCGYHLSAGSANRRKRPEVIDRIVYYCGNYTRYGNTTCSSHTIEARDLHNAVIANINRFAELALTDDKAVKALQAQICTLTATESKAFEREKRKLTKRTAELDKLFTALYEDRVMEHISEHNYALVSGKYEQERLDLENRLREIETELTAKGANRQGITDFLALIRNYGGITKLTATTVNALIDRITVSERAKNEGGATEQRIRIYYKFVGNLHELYIAVQRLTPHIEKKACARCGNAFLPGSNVALYCPECREIVRRETAARANERRTEKRGGYRLVPKPCECCGAAFMPKSHNARFCPACFDMAKVQAAKEWSAAYYQKQKAAAL